MAPSALSAVLLIGAGREAAAAVRYFARAAPRARLAVCDDDPGKAEAFAKVNAIAPIALDALASEACAARDCLWLRAPSVSPTHAASALARRIGKPMTTYLGYWLSQHGDAAIATVTGTKGKSSATMLTAQILQCAGEDVVAGGNIGVVPEKAPTGERWVLETSSYQLHDMPAAARVHALTSLYAEHLDWHGGFDAYVADKLRPYTLRPDCVGLMQREMRPRVAHLANAFFNVEDIAEIDNGGVRLAWRGARAAAPLSDASRRRLAVNPLLRATFLMSAALAAVAGASPVAEIARTAALALDSWEGLPSRQRLIGDFAGRHWIDDALATIPQATVAALASLEGKCVRLIVGGRDRSQDFTPLIAYLAAHPGVKLYGYGPAIARMAHALSDHAISFKTFEETLAAAFAESAAGDVILFSPAGATPEAGASYEDRARAFAAFARSAG